MDKIKKILLVLLILILPYHHQIISVVLSDFTILKFWKEMVIGALLLITLLQFVIGKKKFSLSRFEILLISFMAVLFFYVCISDSKYQALYISRVYFMPMLLVPVIKNTEITKQDIRRMLYLIMANTLLLCVWGIFQAQILGDEFLVNLGYQTQRVSHTLKLKNEFYILGGGFMQRVASTFAAPNTCGMYLAIVITVMVYLNKNMKINRIYTYITIAISAVALILTFSRTSWIACMAALVIYFILCVRWDKRTWRNILICLSAGVAILVVADFFVIHSGIVAAAYRLVYNTVTGQDSSLIGHLKSWVESVIRIFRHPLGLGLGNNGPRAMLFLNKPNLTESSYFLMAYEVGILGAILYFSSYVIAAIDNIHLYRKTGNKNIVLVLSVLVIIALGYLSLPYVQDFEILVFVYSIVTLQYNCSLMSDAGLERAVV